jgi:hypothetical protein
MRGVCYTGERRSCWRCNRGLHRATDTASTAYCNVRSVYLMHHRIVAFGHMTNEKSVSESWSTTSVGHKVSPWQALLRGILSVNGSIIQFPVLFRSCNLVLLFLESSQACSSFSCLHFAVHCFTTTLGTVQLFVVLFLRPTLCFFEAGA